MPATPAALRTALKAYAARHGLDTYPGATDYPNAARTVTRKGRVTVETTHAAVCKYRGEIVGANYPLISVSIAEAIMWLDAN